MEQILISEQVCLIAGRADFASLKHAPIIRGGGIIAWQVVG